MRVTLFAMPAALAVAPAVVHACSCTTLPPLSERYAATPVVFAGRVIDTLATGSAGRPMRMLVTTGLKGVHTGEMVIVDNAAPTSCRWSPGRGASFVVFANAAWGGAVARTYLCAGNLPLACAAPVFRVARQRPPREAGECPTPARGDGERAVLRRRPAG